MPMKMPAMKARRISRNMIPLYFNGFVAAEIGDDACCSDVFAFDGRGGWTAAEETETVREEEVFAVFEGTFVNDNTRNKNFLVWLENGKI